MDSTEACSSHCCPAAIGLSICPHVTQMGKGKAKLPEEVPAFALKNYFLEHLLSPENSDGRRIVQK